MTDDHTHAPAQDDGEQTYVGTATMQEDGTIELHLRAETDDGMVGEAVRFYKPDDPSYASVQAHVGPLQPGGSVAVKPFD